MQNLLVPLTGAIMFAMVYTSATKQLTGHSISSSANWYAVFSCSTPGEKNHRGYDFCFYLPLTVLAWQRIGFQSVVLITGTRIEWERSRPLSWILSHLEALAAQVVFLDAKIDNRATVSQAARPFVVNKDQFASDSANYLVTSDADLWPLHKEHYTPAGDKTISLVHGMCCGFFRFNGSVYRMYPMSNIGATVGTWRRILNDGHSFANDSGSILHSLADCFGPTVYDKTFYGGDHWYVDQKLVSMRIQHWIAASGSHSVHLPSDDGFSRLDRKGWSTSLKACRTNRTVFEKMYDAHLPMWPFLPEIWKRIRPLTELMYGAKSRHVLWADRYAVGFHDILKRSKLI